MYYNSNKTSYYQPIVQSSVQDKRVLFSSISHHLYSFSSLSQPYSSLTIHKWMVSSFVTSHQFSLIHLLWTHLTHLTHQSLSSHLSCCKLENSHPSNLHLTQYLSWFFSAALTNDSYCPHFFVLWCTAHKLGVKASGTSLDLKDQVWEQSHSQARVFK